MAFLNASQFSAEESRAFFDSFDTILTDCDGVLWHGNEPIAGSPEMVNKFRQMGKRVIFVTNNSAKSRKDFATKCHQLGFGGCIVSSITILATVHIVIFCHLAARGKIISVK